MTRPRSLLTLAVALALGAAACGDTSPPDDRSAGAEAPAASAVTIVARDRAFDVVTVEVGRDQPVAITFENQDDDVPHNLHVRGTAAGDVMTDIETGPVTQTLEVTFDSAGTVSYLCDVHPDTMQGTITVSS